MKIKMIRETKLYCEDDIGNFESLLTKGDYVSLQTTDGSIFEGSIEDIHDNSVEINDCDSDNVEIEFCVIAEIRIVQ